MAFDFPSGPSEGQVYSPAGGPKFVYYAPAWRQVTKEQIVQIQTPTAEARNRIVNPAMQISQENGTTSGTTNGYYMADQWTMIVTSTGVFTAAKVASPTPNGSSDRLRITVTTADTTPVGGEALRFQHRIEGLKTADFRWGSASAKSVILRYGFKGPAGTYSISLRNGYLARSYIANFTIAAGQANTDTVQTFVIPGDAAGTWSTGTDLNLYVDIVLGAGSTYLGTTGWQANQYLVTSANSNAMAMTAGSVFELFDVGLYLDAANTGVAPPWQAPDYADELEACMRYWQIMPSLCAYGYAPGANYYALWSPIFPVQMRVTPALANRVVGGLSNATLFNDQASAYGVGRFGATSTAAGLFYVTGHYYACSARM